MLRNLLTIITSLSVCATTSLPDQIHLMRNPTHHATYSPAYSPPATSDAARLLIIGDVHGMLDELKQLLDKADFTASRGDRVIFVGDLVNKGPESAGVVQYAMDINATSVRGNHEDKVLRVWAGAEEARLRAETKGKDGDKAYKAFKKSLGSKKKDALRVAQSLTPEQRVWLSEAPVALRLGDLPGLGDVAVVHVCISARLKGLSPTQDDPASQLLRYESGMVPGISVENQEPWAMYNIRALIGFNGQNKATKSDEFMDTIEERLTDMYPGTEPSKSELKDAKKSAIASYQDIGYIPTGEFKDGTWWVESWNEQQKALPESDRLTLVYGHDSKRGLQMKDYSFGLDSGCVSGEQLTALVLQPKGDGEGKIVTLEHQTISVSCPGGS